MIAGLLMRFHSLTRWEHHVTRVSSIDQLESHLRFMGGSGWECVAIDWACMRVVMKRRLS